MDADKIKQWIEMTQKYQNGRFWEMVFDENPPGEIVEENGVQSGRQPEKKDSGNYPKTDIFLTDTDIILLMEIPGAMREDMALSVSGTKLTVRGILHPPMINGATVVNERKYGEFQRTIDLPEPAESKGMHARFENGLLIITYPRRYVREETILIR
ncbi:Hsp20/alpha crystallin family protein [Neobacillus notoginsengisoli]|uniref:Hsp20/alpha crystallin family protein n=1 Tax=Neobacillus notoginsengisoli TaxID=1578198 RepID=A0A417YTL1_9BACI|nr:Hsp20/alpha crystallin family protein [Neobacillus notoginsengisoli]RHW40336.1 Hsp20/alpha crystallin family protein [Neobacillus notoginsengisoli]